MWLLLSISLALAGPPTKRPSDKDVGAAIYRDHCWSCHGRRALGDGPLAKGTTPAPPALAGRVADGDREELKRLILEGRGDMPGYAAVFTPPDAGRVLVWLEGLDPVTGLGAAGRKAVQEAEEDDDEDEALEAGEAGEAAEAEEPEAPRGKERPVGRANRPVPQ